MPQVPLAQHQGKPQKSVPCICSNAIKRSLPRGISAASYNSSGQGEDSSRKCQGGAGSRFRSGVERWCPSRLVHQGPRKPLRERAKPLGCYTTHARSPMPACHPPGAIRNSLQALMSSGLGDDPSVRVSKKHKKRKRDGMLRRALTRLSTMLRQTLMSRMVTRALALGRSSDQEVFLLDLAGSGWWRPSNSSGVGSDFARRPEPSQYAV